MPKKNHISDYVGIAPGFLRSINLANDWDKTENSSGYIITPNVSQSLERIFQGLAISKGQRAFSLIGPYGTGKSAFAVFLCQLLGSNQRHSKKALELLLKENSQSFLDTIQIGTVKKGGKGYLPITITARRRPISQLILEGSLEAVFKLKQTSTAGQLISRMQKALEKKYWQDSATILQFLLDIKKEAKKQKYSGLLVLIDEAGKTLEYALQDRGGGDVYIFQEIAELANRQQEVPILFLIILHQMFDDYVELSDRTIRNEWAKVQERFQSIQFTESAATTIRMVAKAIQHKKQFPIKIESKIAEELLKLKKIEVPLPIGIDFDTFEKLARQAWPLHPSVLLSIPYLFRRLAQNERSIFSYLTSLEPFGFQEYLKKGLSKDEYFVRLKDIYSYLLANFEVGLSRLPHAKRLLEANDIIHSKAHLTQEQVELIRTSALLNILGEMCPLGATPQMLTCAASNISEVEKKLEGLRKQSILTHRRLDGTYRVWEGSDVDIHARMKEARKKLQMEGKSLYKTLIRHLPARSMVARRHSLETGAHRYFKVSYAEKLTESKKLIKSLNGAAGLILVLLPQADYNTIRLKIEQVTQSQSRLIVALPRQIDALRGIVEEVACLKWVEKNTEELRDDRVARRELSLRLAEGEQKIAQQLQTLLDPRSAPVGNSCQWFWKGKDRAPRTPVDVTRLLSEACDQIYFQSPCVRNELIARRKISSAASSARRCLMEKMLTHVEQERLGIEGYPPERSIYESVLHASGIHVRDDISGQWKFQSPPKDNPMKLYSCWSLMENEIFSAQIQRVELKYLFEKLSDVPYGLPDGIHPLLFAAFFIQNQDDLFLYRDNSFIPNVQSAHFELLQRRPDLFSVSGARLEGIRKAVVDRLAKGLNQPPKTACVVRALFKTLQALPQVTIKSTKFEDSLGLKMKNCLLQAQSPEELLFNDLPVCYGLDPFRENQTRKNDIEIFFNKLNKSLFILQEHATNLLNQARDNLLKKCGLPIGINGWIELEQKASWMNSRVSHDVLTPFFKCISNGVSDNHNPRSAISFVATRPFEMWTDMDVERFPGLADGVGEQYIKAWQNFGSIEATLTSEEQKQKQILTDQLESQLLKFTKNHSRNAVSAALRELLLKFELNILTEER
jgi:hypothetical protein